MMGASLLSDFEHQYSVQTAEITTRIGRIQNLEKNERVEAICQVQRLLVDVESLLEQMELIVRELDPSRSVSCTKVLAKISETFRIGKDCV